MPDNPPNKNSELTQEFSLWVMPEGREFDRLKTTMEDLRNKYGGPEFDPHVTLLGKINVPPKNLNLLLEKTEALAANLRRYPVQIRDLECLPEYYYKCLFARVNLTPAVVFANAASKPFFRAIPGKHNQGKYEPHLSLIYGSLSEEIKREVIVRLGYSLDTDFEARKIHLYSTDRGPKNWYKIADFKLQ